MSFSTDMVNRLSELWWPFILHATWQSAFVGAIIVAVVALGKRIPSPLRYGLLVVALIKFLVPPISALPFGLISQIEVTAAYAEQRGGSKPIREIPAETTAETGDQVAHLRTKDTLTNPLGSKEDHLTFVSEVELPKGLSLPENTTNESAGLPHQVASLPRVKSNDLFAGLNRISITSWLMLVHIVGTIVVLWNAVTRVWTLNRKVHNATPIESWNELADSLAKRISLRKLPRLVEADWARTPFSFGVVQPTVVFPTRLMRELDDQQLSIVLLHELAHHKRRDLGMIWLQILVSALWWFHPIQWLINRMLSSVREDCCDDLLLSKQLVASESYCELLLKVAASMVNERSRSIPLFASMASRHRLSSRLRRIMDDKLIRRSHVGIFGLLILSAIAFVLLPGMKLKGATGNQASAAAALPAAASLMPNQTQGFVRIVNLSEFVDQWKSTQLGILAQDPRMTDFWNEQRQEIEKRFAEAGWQLNIHPEDVYDIATGQVALGWIARPKDIRKPYSVALIVDIAGREKETQHLLNRIDGELLERKAKAEKSSHAEQTIAHYVLHRAGETTETKTFYTMVSGQLFASDDLETVKSLIDARANPASESLASTELYQTARGQVKTDEIGSKVEYFVRPIGLAHVLRGISKKPKKGRDILQILEKEGFGSLAAACGTLEVGAENFDILHQTYVQTLPPLPVSVQILDFPNQASRTIPNWVNKESSTFMSMAWNIKEAFWKIEGIVDEITEKEGTFKLLIKGLKEDPLGAQIDIQNDVIPYLTSEIYTISDCIVPITPDSRRSLIAMRIVEPEKLSLVLDKIMKNEPNAKSIDFDNHRIWKQLPQEEALDEFDDLGFSGVGTKGKKKPAVDEEDKPWLNTFAVAIHDDFLMISSHAEMIQDAIRLEKDQELASKLHLETDFARVQAAISELTAGSPDSCVWQVNRADRSFEMQYELFRQDQLPQSRSMLATILDRLLYPKTDVKEKNQKVKGGKLPPFDEIRKFFMPGGTIVQTHPDGWSIQSFVLSEAATTAKR